MKKERDIEKIRRQNSIKLQKNTYKKEKFLEDRKEDALYILDRGDYNTMKNKMDKQYNTKKHILHNKLKEEDHKRRLNMIKQEEELKRNELIDKINKKEMRIEYLEYQKAKQQNEKMAIQYMFIIIRKYVDNKMERIYDELHKLPIQSKIKEYINKSRIVDKYEIPITSDLYIIIIIDIYSQHMVNMK